MAVSTNDVTGDAIRTKPSSSLYENNYDSIFRKDSNKSTKDIPPSEPPKQYTNEEVLQWKWVNHLGEPPVTPDKPMEST